jgi:hypothetical protein
MPTFTETTLRLIAQNAVNFSSLVKSWIKMGVNVRPVENLKHLLKVAKKAMAAPG